MKEHLWGIIGTIIALGTLVRQCIKDYKSDKKEKTEQHREEQEKLSLKLCNQIEYYNGIYRIKFINESQISVAYKLNVSIRIKNRHFNYAYKLPDINMQNEIFSIHQEDDKASCESYVHINVLKIEANEINKYASSEISNLYHSKTIELKDILKDKDCYLAVKYDAVNRSNGKIIDFPKQNFNYDSIVHGIFGIGHDFVTPISND